MPLPVVVSVSEPRDTDEPEMVPQFVPVIEVPAQNVKVSSTVAVTVICCAVLAATVPLSTAVVYESSE